MKNEVIIYYKAIYVNEPTDIDIRGQDGIYLKEIKPVTAYNSNSCGSANATPKLLSFELIESKFEELEDITINNDFVREKITDLKIEVMEAMKKPQQIEF